MATLGSNLGPVVRLKESGEQNVVLKFHPKAGTVLLCNYSGFKVPEMVKKRPVIVVSPRLRRRDYLCTVVPLSTVAPDPVCDYHHELTLARPLPSPWTADSHWVKADMMATVGFHRLGLIGVGRDQEGKRKYLNLQVSDEDLKAIRTAVLQALGMGGLAPLL